MSALTCNLAFGWRLFFTFRSSIIAHSVYADGRRSYYEYNLASREFSELFPVGLIARSRIRARAFRFCREIRQYTLSGGGVVVVVIQLPYSRHRPCYVTCGIKHKNDEVKHIVTCVDK